MILSRDKRTAYSPKVIFVNRYFFPDHSATSQMLSDLAFAMAAGGRNISVITSRQKYDDRSLVLPAHEVVDGVEVVRLWTTQFGRRHLGGRAIDYLTFYLASIRAVWRLARPGDTVVVKTDPPILSVWLQPVAKLRRARLINWLQDVFPEVAQVLGVGRGSLASVGYRCLIWLRNHSLKQAACNVVLGQRMASKVSDLGVVRDKIAIIPNWADGIVVRPVDRAANSLRKQWVGFDDFVVGYSGNLGRAHEYRTLIEAMALLEKQANAASSVRIRWLIIGGGALFDEFNADVSRRGLRDVIFLPYQPREKLSESLSASDVHLISLRPELEGLIVPSKFYGVAAAGRASIFIGDRDGEIAAVLRDGDCGVTVATGDGEGLSQEIWRLATDPERAMGMGQNARRVFEANFERKIAVKAWSELLDGQPKS